MAYYYPMYAGDFLPPLVDHIHERPHHHRNLVQFLTRQSQREPEPTQPDVDIRDSFNEYVIEVEVPGIEDAKSINVVWSSNRNLVVSGNIKRPHDEAVTHAAKAGGVIKEEHEFPTLLVNERRVGPFRRYFNFPVDLQMDKMTAKLNAGVLNITIPKKTEDGGKAGKANIL